MAVYIYIPQQIVAPNQLSLLTTQIGCNKGYILHREGSGILTFRGIVNNPCAEYAVYDIDYQANIALPTGTAITPIALGISIDGEVDQSSISISTPTAVEAFNSVSGMTTIKVPRGCCYSISLENAPASTATDYTQVPLLMQNLNVRVKRTA